MPTIEDLVSAADRGDSTAARQLFATLYEELHTLAEHHLHQRGSQLSLGTTTLLHEAYLRLSERDGPRFPDRPRFLAYASRAMRGLVIDYARARRAKKRGGEFEITALVDDVAGGAQDDLPEQVNGAMEQLGALDSDLAQLVDLHFFAGFTFAEIAAMQGKSDRTVQRDWRRARLLLQRLVHET